MIGHYHRSLPETPSGRVTAIGLTGDIEQTLEALLPRMTRSASSALSASTPQTIMTECKQLDTKAI
jgi:hypothetical protein